MAECAKSIDIRQPVPLNVELAYQPKNAEEISSEDRKIAEKFFMPDCALNLVDFFFTEKDKRFIGSLQADVFSAAAVDADYAQDAFRRGILNKADAAGGEWRLNNFYGMLDVFCVSQTKKYRSLSREKRRELDDWYFGEYIKNLNQDLTRRPTADKILTRDETLDFIDGQKNPLYLNYCDCRSLSGDCGLPSRTCINFAPGVNSFQARGLSAPLTKEEAKAVVRKADDAGLVHTLSDHGICNCCGDCCYLFRAQRVRNSVGFWPKTDKIVAMDANRCVACGTCVRRCRFGVFKKQGSGANVRIVFDRANCEGCGLCASACPTGALRLEKRAASDEEGD